MNLGYSSGDDREAVRENRNRLFDALGVRPEEVVVGSQVHATTVLEIGAPGGSRGERDSQESVGEADGLMTACDRTFLFQIFADCVPLFVFDPVHRAIGIGHAGWRGTVTGMGEALLARMETGYQTDPRDVLVGIGPSIGPECYPVGKEVREALLQRYPWAGRYALEGSVDLKAVNREAFWRQGVKENQISVSPLCTSCDNDLLFSYRKEGPKSGRIAGLAGLLGRNKVDLGENVQRVIG